MFGLAGGGRQFELEEEQPSYPGSESEVGQPHGPEDIRRKVFRPQRRPSQASNQPRKPVNTRLEKGSPETDGGMSSGPHLVHLLAAPGHISAALLLASLWAPVSQVAPCEGPAPTCFFSEGHYLSQGSLSTRFSALPFFLGELSTFLLTPHEEAQHLGDPSQLLTPS